MGGMGPGGGGSQSRSSGGLLSGIKDALGLGGDGDAGNSGRTEAAASLAQDYADELQAHLEQKGKWEDIRTTAQG
jgi:hypothetical protein